MIRESAQAGVADFELSEVNNQPQTPWASELAVDGLGRFLTSGWLAEKETKNRRWRTVTVIALSSLAIAASATSSAQSRGYSKAQPAATREAPPMEYVGVTGNTEVWITNRQTAIDGAKEIAESGANMVRIFEPDNPLQLRLDNDRKRFCNAAEATRANNLKLTVSFMGFNKKKEVGYMPVTNGETQAFNSLVNSMLWSVAGPNAAKEQKDKDSKVVLEKCVEEPLDELDIEIFNEVNSGGFNDRLMNQNKALVGPKRYAYLLSKTYPSILREVAKINEARAQSPDFAGRPEFEVRVQAFGLAAAHNPVGFLDETLNELEKLGVEEPPFDILTFHPYPKDPLKNPAEVEAEFYPKLMEVLKRHNMADMPIFYNEIGVSSRIPKTKKKFYAPKVRNLPGVTEATQGQYYKEVLEVAACQPNVIGVLTFKNRDDWGDRWISGTQRPDGSSKSSRFTVSQAFKDAATGTLTKC